MYYFQIFSLKGDHEKEQLRNTAMAHTSGCCSFQVWTDSNTRANSNSPEPTPIPSTFETRLPPAFPGPGQSFLLYGLPARASAYFTKTRSLHRPHLSFLCGPPFGSQEDGLPSSPSPQLGASPTAPSSRLFITSNLSHIRRACLGAHLTVIS